MVNTLSQNFGYSSQSASQFHVILGFGKKRKKKQSKKKRKIITRQTVAIKIYFTRQQLERLYFFSTDQPADVNGEENGNYNESNAFWMEGWHIHMSM